MGRGLPDNMSQDVLEKNRKILESVGALPPVPISDHFSEQDEPGRAPTKADTRAEKELQQQVELWLHHRGYRRRAPAWMDPMVPWPAQGWQIHLNKPVGNPILLDVLLLGNDGRFLEIELKVAGGRLSAEQQYLVDKVHPPGRPDYPPPAWVCWSFDQVEALVKGWEAKKGAFTE